MRMVTSMTLLEKVKKNVDNKSWTMFYDLYSPLIFRFARKYGCDITTSEDIVQETMCQLLRYLPGFQYQRKRGKFRSYLFQIVISCIRKRSNPKIPTESLDQFPDKPHLKLADSHSAALKEEFERQRKKNLVQHALIRVKERVEPLTWKSFESFLLRNKKSADEIAVELGIEDRNVVYQHKNRVIRFLREEIKQLEQEIGEDDDLISEKKTDFEKAALTTLTYNSEYPDSKVRKRFKLLQNAFHNHPPVLITTTQILVVTKGNSRWESVKDNFSIGSDKSNDLQLKSEYISKCHCLLSLKNQRWMIQDLQSKNGAVVNGNKVAKKTLNNGDIIQLGNVILVLISANNEPLEKGYSGEL